MTLCGQSGINTFLGRIDDRITGVIDEYRSWVGAPIPWIGQTAKKPQNGASREEIHANIRLAQEHGALGVYIQGQSADWLVRENKIDELAGYLDFIRNQGMVAGIGAHDIVTIEASEKEKLQPDFYMKTFNPLEYACPNYDRTVEVMSSITIPWIAFKILAAGRLEPKEGFQQAIDANADFLCVGMFDFQVKENAELARELLL